MAGVPSSIARVVLTCLFPVFAATGVAAQEMRTVMGVVADSGGRTVAYVSLDGGAKYRTRMRWANGN